MGKASPGWAKSGGAWFSGTLWHPRFPGALAWPQSVFLPTVAPGRKRLVDNGCWRPGGNLDLLWGVSAAFCVQ